MPLAFESISHGTIAFGFFNIDSDMLLLDRHFFFSTDFCGYMNEIAACEPDASKKLPWQVYHIPDPQEIGDLMGAIHGVHFSGFIGEVYRKYPFPRNEADFKQKPEGIQTQDIVKAIIEKYGERSEILFTMDKPQNEAAIGAYRFSRSSFQALIRYVWQGGYPRWRDGTPPDYVLTMKDRVLESRCALFQDLDLSF